MKKISTITQHTGRQCVGKINSPYSYEDLVEQVMKTGLCLCGRSVERNSRAISVEAERHRHS
jgi:hypothetical protein